MRLVIAGLLTVTFASAGIAQDQEEYDAQYVRMYNTLSAVAITGSLTAGAWSYRAPHPLAHFASFVFAAAEYGLFLTGMRSESVSRGLSIGNLAARGDAATLALLGMEKERKERDRARRERQGVHVSPMLSATRAGVSVTLRF